MIDSLPKTHYLLSMWSLFWKWMRYAYGFFFIVAGFFLLYTIAAHRLQQQSPLLLGVLAAYLVFTGLLMVIPLAHRERFVPRWFRDRHSALLLCWLSLPFLGLSTTLLVRGSRSDLAVPGLVVGLLLAGGGLILRRVRRS